MAARLGQRKRFTNLPHKRLRLADVASALKNFRDKGEVAALNLGAMTTLKTLCLRLATDVPHGHKDLIEAAMDMVTVIGELVEREEQRLLRNVGELMSYHKYGPSEDDEDEEDWFSCREDQEYDGVCRAHDGIALVHEVGPLTSSPRSYFCPFHFKQHDDLGPMTVRTPIINLYNKHWHPKEKARFLVTMFDGYLSGRRFSDFDEFED